MSEPGATGQVSRLLALARPEWRTLALGTVFLVIGSASGLLYPQAVREIMDTAVATGDRTTIDRAALYMLGLFLVQGVAITCRAYLFGVAGERIVTRLRDDLFARLVDREIAFFDRSRTGELLNRLGSDTAVLQNTVSVNVSMTLRNGAGVLGGVGFLFATSPVLAALMLLVVPPLALGTVWAGRVVRRLSARVQDALAEANEVAEESFSGIRTVRSFAQEEAQKGRYRVANDRSFALAKRRAAAGAWFMGGSSLAGYAAIAGVFWYGGRLVLDGALTAGELTQFVLYTLIVAFSLGMLGSVWADLMRAVGASARVFALLDEGAETAAASSGSRPERCSGAISFEGVRFHYPSRPDVEVLRGIDLSLRPGERVALVGASGAGKSTIGALLARLYDPTAGMIRLDGADIRSLDVRWLRSQLGFVSQEPLLFSMSIADNIRYGRPGATDEEVRAAAREAFADGFIQAFPDGYETWTGERGVQLSGGQKQRIAIARAILRDPRVLVLDEATSALDAESESVVNEALERLLPGRTTLIIAHRLSTVRSADRILVMEGGAVVDEGNHAALIARDGLYRRLVSRQLRDSGDAA